MGRAPDCPWPPVHRFHLLPTTTSIGVAPVQFPTRTHRSKCAIRPLTFFLWVMQTESHAPSKLCCGQSKSLPTMRFCGWQAQKGCKVCMFKGVGEPLVHRATRPLPAGTAGFARA
jgi:hypothetical protein